MEIHLLRHAVTQWNKLNKAKGHTNVPLSSKGRENVSELEYIEDELVNELDVYSSDLARCAETAEIVGFDDFETDPRLRERSFGEWEGLKWDQIYDKNPDLPEYGSPEWWNLSPPNGESHREMRERALEVFNEVIEEGEDTLIVSHSGPLRFITAEILEKDPIEAMDEIHFSNCGYLNIDYSVPRVSARNKVELPENY